MCETNYIKSDANIDALFSSYKEGMNIAVGKPYFLDKHWPSTKTTAFFILGSFSILNLY